MKKYFFLFFLLFVITNSSAQNIAKVNKESNITAGRIEKKASSNQTSSIEKLIRENVIRLTTNQEDIAINNKNTKKELEYLLENKILQWNKTTTINSRNEEIDSLIKNNVIQWSNFKFEDIIVDKNNN